MGSVGHNSLLSLYDLIWSAALPMLRRHARVGTGFDQRTLGSRPLPGVDLWIQAASAGEAYLAGLLARGLQPRGPLRVLFTTNTQQGHEILEKTVGPAAPGMHAHISTFIRYLPFDQPRIMARAVAQAHPRAAILLETELWPAMLHYLKQSGCPVLLLNGRLTPKSVNRYRALCTDWTCLAPDRVEAISREDALRFRRIFPHTPIRIMNNMKFDRIAAPRSVPDAKLDLDNIISAAHPLAVLGSIRQPEEAEVAGMLDTILSHCPDAQVALVPRHMHRVSAWGDRLSKRGLPWVRRSRLNAPCGPGRVILWDTFGELAALYRRSRAVFVGGSLAPLGGQNFLEPLTCGIAPVIGPHWDNFKWVGQELFRQGLVRKVADGSAAADQLLKDLQRTPCRRSVAAGALAFIRRRQGGTRQGCRLVEEYLYDRIHRPY